jgi:hypothetical protein
MVKRRWKATLSLSSAFLLGVTLQAQAHQAVTLKDINGTPISQTLDPNKTVVVGGVTYEAGNPVSWEATCGSCHSKITGDVSEGLRSPGPIHATYHVGRGWDEMADDFGANRVREHKDWRKFLRSFGDDGAW